jgi:hypothetical protein
MTIHLKIIIVKLQTKCALYIYFLGKGRGPRYAVLYPWKRVKKELFNFAFILKIPTF